jgi:CRISPR system Cascade subunit CasD
LRRPAYPLFLGRKSCPPAGQLDHGIHRGTVLDVLTTAPWLASPWTQRRYRHESHVDLDIVHDCPPSTPGSETVRDDPISFDPRHRQYGWRTITHTRTQVLNPYHVSLLSTADVDPHDPIAPLGEPL